MTSFCGQREHVERWILFVKKKRISKKFKAIESSSYKQEFRYNPSYIRLLPNTQYVIRHNGMGAKVNIIKYFYTDSSGNLHYKCDEKSSRKSQEP